MSNLENVWAATSTEGGFDEDKPAPAGYMGIVRIADVRTGVSKKGESYFLVELKDDSHGYSWPIYKQFTKNGQPHEGSIKSAKITLRQLGLDGASPANLEQALKSIVGRYFSVEQVASDRLNTVTGMPYVNTNITGAASAPSGVMGDRILAAAQAQAAPVQFAQPTQVQTPQGVAAFPSAVSGPTLDQAMTQPGAQFGDSIPWENGG
jgi:hypothetical protein